jgi:alpha-glucosidase
LELRKEFLVGAGGITWLESCNHGSKGDSLLSYTRGGVTVVMNLSDSAVECDADGRLLIVSGGTVDARDGKKVIPARSTAWFLT